MIAMLSVAVLFLLWLFSLVFSWLGGVWGGLGGGWGGLGSPRLKWAFGSSLAPRARRGDPERY